MRPPGPGPAGRRRPPHAVVAGQLPIPVAGQLAGVALETVDGLGSPPSPATGAGDHPGLAVLEELRRPTP